MNLFETRELSKVEIDEVDTRIVGVCVVADVRTLIDIFCAAVNFVYFTYIHELMNRRKRSEGFRKI